MDAMVDELRDRSVSKNANQKINTVRAGSTVQSPPNGKELPFLGSGYMLGVIKDEEKQLLKDISNKRRKARNLTMTSSQVAKPRVDKELRQFNKNLTAQ